MIRGLVEERSARAEEEEGGGGERRVAKSGLGGSGTRHLRSGGRSMGAARARRLARDAAPRRSSFIERSPPSEPRHTCAASAKAKPKLSAAPPWSHARGGREGGRERWEWKARAATERRYLCQGPQTILCNELQAKVPRRTLCGTGRALPRERDLLPLKRMGKCYSIEKY